MDRQEYWRQRYTEVRPEWMPTTAIYGRLVDDLVHHETRVLDIGCGHADLVASSLARTERAVGIDADERALAATLSGLGYERERIVLNGDPTYVALDEPFFRVGVLLERIYDLRPLRRARVHIVGVYRTSGASGA